MLLMGPFNNLLVKLRGGLSSTDWHKSAIGVAEVGQSGSATVSNDLELSCTIGIWVFIES